MRGLRRRHGRKRGRAGTFLGAEHRRERDEAVEVNIPPHLLPLWRKTRLQFKGDPHRRYEQFMHYAGETDGEDMAAVQSSADDTLDAMIRERTRVACPPRHPCSPNCMSSLGGVCTCSCGGQNHGVCAAA